MSSVIAWVIPVLFVSILLEMLWSWKKKKAVYNTKETISNVTIFVGVRLLKPITTAWLIFALTWVAQFRVWTIPIHVWTLLLAIVFVDFLYYWHHRLNHEVRILWTLHNVHHSSPWMNLTTSMRLNWMAGFVTPMYYLPAVLLGFSVDSVLLFFVLNLFFQFFLHTEAIDKLPFVEGWLNTPSAHRVHHGSNELYIDKNYGGVFMIWDRLFGTYQAESEKVIYGVTTGFQGHNPFKAVFGPMVDYFRGQFSRERSHIEVQQPKAADEAQPQGSDQALMPSQHTADEIQAADAAQIAQIADAAQEAKLPGLAAQEKHASREGRRRLVYSGVTS